jgi:hypothetical protein
MKISLEHYPNGVPRILACHDENNQLHNDRGPAIQHWREDGTRKSKEWAIHGKNHREDGPAYILYNGGLTSSRYFLNGVEYDRQEWELRTKGVEVTANGETKYISEQSAKELGLI